MRLETFGKLVRYRRRLEGLSLPRKAYFVINALCGETLRTRGPGTVGLRLVEIAVTDRCQCRCVHCYVARRDEAGQGDELTRSEIQALLDEARALHATEVCFSGGEPLLRKDLVDLVRYGRQQGMAPKINTNGLLLDEPMVIALKHAGLAWCSVSIDSADPDEHDRLRKHRGCYAAAVEGLKLLARHGVPSSISTYARKDAVWGDGLARIARLGHDLGVETVRILFPVPMGRFEDAVEEMLTREEREQVRKMLKDPIVTMESPHEGSRCTAGVTKVNVRENGDVTPCVFVPLPYGNIRQESFRKIWQAIAEFDRMHKPTGQCPMGDARFRDWLFKKKELPVRDVPDEVGVELDLPR